MVYEQIWIAIQASIQQLPVTLFMTIVSLLIGGFLGLIVALVRYFEVPILSPLFRVFVTILRGIPVLLILLVSYLIISEYAIYISENYDTSFSFDSINPAFIAIIGFSLMSLVQTTEAFRGSLNSIDEGQLDAAKSIGMTRFQLIRRVLLPQMFPIALPQLGNSTITVLKATSLASLITVVDVLQGALITANNNYRYFESYLGAALIYWILSIIIEQVTKLLEKRSAYITKGAKS